MRSTLSTSRSFVLAALRALHLDRRLRPTAKSTGDNAERTTKNPKFTPLRGSSTQISTSEIRQSVDLDRVRTYSPPPRCLGGHSNPQTNRSALEERRPPCASSSPGATAAS